MKAVFVPVLALLSSLPAAYASLVPAHQVLKTKNGVPVYFFRSPNVPLFQIELVFEGGSDWDPKGKSGLAQMSASMLKRGTSALDENQISKKIDDWAAGVDFDVGEESFNVSIYGLNDKAPEIISLAFDALEKSVFPDKPFKRLKDNRVDMLSQLPDSPSAIAGRAIDLLVFNDSYKARPSSGFLRDIKAISLDEAKAFFPQLARTDRLKVLVIGGQEPDEILSRVIPAIETLPCGFCGKELPKTSVSKRAEWRDREKVFLIKRSGISEAHVRMGMLGPKRDIPEFYDLRVAETILSGTFSSRMNMLLREKLNLTYGISAGFWFGKDTGSFSVQTSTRNEKAGVLIKATRALLEDFARNGVTEQEINEAKDYIVGSFPLGLQNRYEIATQFFKGLLTGLNADFLDVFSTRIRATTRESVNAALKKHFDPRKLFSVVAGDPKLLSEPFKKEGITFQEHDPAEFL